MTIIAPSILSADFMNLGSELKKFDGAKDLWIHLDIMDGHFVPNLTFGQTVLKNISKYTNHKLDAHFMVNNPQDYLNWFQGVGLHNFTFHWEAVTHHDSFVKEIKKSIPSVGVSLNPSTPIEVIPEYLFQEIDLVLIMSVNPGFGGQSFIEGTRDKIKKLKELKQRLNTEFEIQVDGGVSDKNAKDLIQDGATNLVAGSFVFKAENGNYLDQVEKLRG